MTTYILQRMFSLESGSYSGSKRTPSESNEGIGNSAVVGGLVGAALGGLGGGNLRSAAVGGLIGAGLGAVTRWLSNITDQSNFNSGISNGYNSYSFLDELDLEFNETTQDSEVTTSETETKEIGGRAQSRTVTRKATIRPKREAEGVLYSVDGDPKKHIVSILFSGSAAALYINFATPREVQIIDEVLDDYCKHFKNANYIAEKIGKGSYFVDLKLIRGFESWVGIDLIKHGIKLNVITGQRFGIKKK